MSNKKIIIIVGTRPNYMKVAPLLKYLKNYKIISTGQHYGGMDQHQLLPTPDYNLNLQTSNIKVLTSEIYSILEIEDPGLVIVVGDLIHRLLGLLPHPILILNLLTSKQD